MSDPGPQLGPASSARIAAQTKAILRELRELDCSWPPKFNECRCQECNQHLIGRIFFTCQKCGNKRCPKCVSHKYKCTGSNAPGQTFELEADHITDRAD